MTTSTKTVHRGAAFELDTVASGWQVALDAADHALSAAHDSLPGADLERRRRELTQERADTATLLAGVAQATHVHPTPWLSPVPLSTRMLGLPATTRACVFDLDGVLTDSGFLHALAWAEVFDELLLRVSERAGWHFIPFDRGADYRAYLDGRPRLEGIHTFLSSRGIRLPTGQPDDLSHAETAYGLARHKSEALARGLHLQGVACLAGARRYLEAAGHTGLERGVISASASTMPMLELAGLAPLVEAHIDADAIRTETLRSRPAPDTLLAVCRRLGVRPAEAVAFTNSPAGVAAGHAAGLEVIGVAAGAQAETLRGFGAAQVIPRLSVLLDRRLVEATDQASGQSAAA